MSSSGGQPEEPWERIRPAPRAVRATSPPAQVPVSEPEPSPPVLDVPPAPLHRPDRAKMDPLSLDRSSSRKLSRLFRREKRTQLRSRRARRIDRWVIRSLTFLLMAGVIGAALWSLRQRLGSGMRKVFVPPAPARAVATPAERIPDMLESFLTASGTTAKAAHVLDRARVEPLMDAIYAQRNLPEDQLRFGVPQPLEPGVWVVPAKVLGPPEFLLHLMVREEQGEFKLDWETYEQELAQRFTTFAASPGKAGGDFRLVLERAHAFAAGPDESIAVRIAAPGSPALAEPVTVRPDLAPSLANALPWNRRRRALVHLEWHTPAAGPPRLLLTEVVKWEFLP